MSVWEFLKQVFIEFLESLKRSFEESQTGPQITRPKTRNERALSLASQEIGVKEVGGQPGNPRIRKYHAYAREDNDVSQGQHESVAWCSSFVCWVVENVGMGSTNSMVARSWLRWGVSTKSAPLPGDIVVFWRVRPDSWQGHVGFWVGETETHVWCLGGNQSNAVNATRYQKTQLLDIRRSSRHEPITEEVRANLNRMASHIRQQRSVDLFGNQIS